MQTVSEDPEHEVERLNEAMSAMWSLDLLDGYDPEESGEHLEILKTYRMIAEDRGWFGRAARGGQRPDGGGGGLQGIERYPRAQKVNDPYIRERLMDMDDLGYRLLQHLTGEAGSAECSKTSKVSF